MFEEADDPTATAGEISREIQVGIAAPSWPGTPVEWGMRRQGLEPCPPD